MGRTSFAICLEKIAMCIEKVQYIENVSPLNVFEDFIKLDILSVNFTEGFDPSYSLSFVNNFLSESRSRIYSFKYKFYNLQCASFVTFGL